MRFNLLLPFFILPFCVRASEYIFDKTFIGDGDVNLSLFNEGGNPSGRYMTTITLNGKEVDKRELDFKNGVGNKLETCILDKDLVKYNVKRSSIDNYSDNACFDFKKNEMTSMTFDFYNKILSLYFPDKDINSDDGSYAPKPLWDEGVNAFLLDYQYNINNTEDKRTSNKYQSSSLIMQPKLSVNGWILNNMLTWNKSFNGQGGWESNYLTLSKGIYSINSRLSIGELYTPSDVFDSSNIDGMMLSSDDNMIPLSQRDFVPTVTGSATSQSTVEVYQGSNLVAKQVVNAGNFEINQFTYLINGVDLKVIVHGSDGTTQVFYVPYIAPAIAIHEGNLKYNVSVGRSKSKDNLIQTSAIYGLPYGVSTLSGSILSKNYKSVAAGMGYMAGRLGAISFTTKIANVTNQMKKQKINSFDISYNNIIGEGFSVFIKQKFNGKKGYYNINDIGSETITPFLPLKKSTSLLLSKFIDSVGVFSLNGVISEDIKKNKTQSYGVNFNTAIFNRANLNVGIYRNNSEFRIYERNSEKSQNNFTISISIPFGGNTLSYQYNKTSQDDGQSVVGFNGSYLEDRFNLSMNASSENGSNNKTLSAIGDYKNPVGNISLSGTEGNQYSAYGFSTQGRALFYSGGLVFGQQQGSTVAIIDTNNINDVGVGFMPGVYTNFMGKTLYGYLSPYQSNLISINPLTLGNDVSSEITTVPVIPTEGAVVVAKFNTKAGVDVVFDIIQENGRPVPFGSVASFSTTKSTENIINSGIVGENGRLFSSVENNSGWVKVNVSKGRFCGFYYDLNKDKRVGGIVNIKAVCK
ncbi:fimbria/pilus outer membrane usher protein [Citrobacter freundii]|uniref:fimbria/pilus outer membrane usher protein n=1 Tax=Citrobacter freundii TaxID=546 RepID=UPI001EF0C5FE|nr:fimbria/pilus outer membrane usher protein [Citrobacter freundii]